MKRLAILRYCALVMLGLVACQGASGAPVLTPLGASLEDMTGSATQLAATPTSGTPQGPSLEDIAETLTPGAAGVATNTSIPPSPSFTVPPNTQASAAQASPAVTIVPTIAETPCALAWFTTQASPGACPLAAPIGAEAAYQSFEHGAMLWWKGGDFVILPFNPSTGVQAGIVAFYPEQVTVYRDTSSQYTPPAGLFAPGSGFGLVWRGDVFESPGISFQADLGWATAPEKGYTITKQDGRQLVSFNGTNNISLISYYTLPDGRLLRLSRLGSPNQFWSINFVEP